MGRYSKGNAMQTKNVSVVIPNWNGIEYLPRCISSLLTAFEVYPGDHEIIVVDDGSTDKSVELLRRQFCSVKVIELGSNMGFCVACNEGVDQSRNDIVVLLNTDTYVKEDFLQPLVSHFSDDAQLFGVGCKMVSWDGFLQIGPIWGKFEHGLIDGEHDQDPSLKTPCVTCFICLGACAVNKQKYLKLGGVGDLHRRSDIDVSYRARKRGWQLLYDPRSVVHHKGRGTDDKRWNWRQRAIETQKDRILLTWKNLTDADLLRRHILQLPLLPFYWGWRITIPALGRAILNLPDVVTFRRAECGHIKVTDREVLRVGRDGE